MTQPPPNGPAPFVRESSRIGLNLIALVASRFMCLALSVVQVGIIFRALGREGSGQWGYALNYPALFTVFATLGIQRLLVRDIARNPDIAWTRVWTATGLVAVLSTVVTGVIMLSVLAIDESPVVRAAVFASSLSVIVLWALQRPFEGLLMARERMALIAVVNIIAGTVRLGSVYLAMRESPTSATAHAAIAVGNSVGFVLMTGAAIAAVGWERPTFRLSLALSQVRECLPFTVAALFSMIYFKSDVSLLKWLAGEGAAGIYTLPQRVMEPLLMIAGIWGTAVFPALCRFSVTAPGNYERLMRTSARLALMLAFPMGAGIAVLSGSVVGLLAGERAGEFALSVQVLRILCVVVPMFYLNGVGQEFLYASHRNWVVARTYGLASLLSVGANLLLIPTLGPAGAACTAIATNLCISVLFVHEMRGDYGAMGLIPLVAKTLAACGVMAGVTYALAGVSLILSVVVGGLVYLGLQAALRTLTSEERRMMVSLVRAPFARRA
ncbi:MAG: oligosaccharide flippase family protein [Nitrospiraceae bacterium]|nr:oligosaccharide flippase family protein [Nitrospiraceae bacterium]